MMKLKLKFLPCGARVVAVFVSYLAFCATPSSAGRIFNVLEATDKIVYTRIGCKAVLTCSGYSTSEPIWEKRGDNAVSVVTPNEVDNVTVPDIIGLNLWTSSIIFSSLKEEDQALFSCTINKTKFTTALKMDPSVASIQPIANVSLSSYDADQIISISCRVDTCLTDVVVQFFRGSELLDSSTSAVESGWQGTIELRASEKIVGEYVCRAMSDNANKVFPKSFSVLGALRG